MKGFIAFIAHCPELRENQRVVVVGECPELGGWELGGALSLAPAPCGRPWWVSSEVEVNLPESTMGVSGDFVNGVGAGGEDGWVGVSELKFRLLAIPNDGKEVQVSHPGNLVCLEPLRGGDFRIVRLVGAPPLSDCSSVGRRGVNTVCVGAEGGGEHQKRELVGISVEWGVSESVQLALLDLPANHQTDQSEIASPPSTEGGGQRESGRFDARSHHTVCRPQSAVEPKRSDGERGRGSGSKNMTERVWQRAADAQSDDPTSPPDPSNSTHLQMRDRTRDVQPRQGQSEKTDEPAVSMKRRRSESYLAQVDSLVEADACDEVSGCSGERRGGGLRGESVEGGASVSTAAFARSANSAEGTVSVSTAARDTSARIVEGRASVSTAARDTSARIVEGRASVSTAAFAHSARIAEGRVSASTAAFALAARSAEERAYASTAGNATSARTVEGGASVSTVACALGARNVAGKAFASTEGSAAFARTAEGGPSVFIEGSVDGARIARGSLLFLLDRFAHFSSISNSFVSAYDCLPGCLSA
uniref:CBM20 domain-containing protein n=1 Tax=Chromera velia CCMP2878 TaxID=1169474 RepID=A0A0G4HEF9_9ALVE|eukprot:Cvel_6492.t1-p1 / transcript=Cvel_6492.t1 / gene=Cvel_6492 / organism=Chromera_velia_CCMP2878 / gene_product=Keratin-associated protein 5-3, putative / transcript_product=Keratin-associated protein 5-3, putative / location=Cvel_scaffold318:59477-61307(+) / protein_length=533 / sequence_SO=supercontig / SO=protein_coding / is_pseudo=false